MKHVHVVRTGHDRVANAGNHKHRDVVFDAILQNNVAVMAVDAADKHRVDAVQHRQIFNTLCCRGRRYDLVLAIQAILADQLFQTLARVIDYSSSLRREGLKVRVVCAASPDCRQNQLSNQCCHTRQDVGQMLAQQPDNDVHNKVADCRRQKLRIDDFGYAVHRH